MNMAKESTPFFPAKIRTYLSIVPHEKKFCFSMTQKIITDSVNLVPNFSFEDAVVSFENINVYATNLLRQPWRKEFENISVSTCDGVN